MSVKPWGSGISYEGWDQRDVMWSCPEILGTWLPLIAISTGKQKQTFAAWTAGCGKNTEKSQVHGEWVDQLLGYVPEQSLNRFHQILKNRKFSRRKNQMVNHCPGKMRKGCFGRYPNGLFLKQRFPKMVLAPIYDYPYVQGDFRWDFP